MVLAGPGDGPHVVDRVGPGHSHHLRPPVEEEVALLVVVTRLPISVVRELSPGQSLTWR